MDVQLLLVVERRQRVAVCIAASPFPHGKSVDEDNVLLQFRPTHT
jgi:hypothetical protein